MPRILKRPARAPGEAKASDHWRTPAACFDALDREFKFSVDLAADAANKLCPVHLGPGSAIGADALAVDWHVHRGPGWLNPPYSSALIKAFLEKAVTEAHAGFTAGIVYVLSRKLDDDRYARQWLHAQQHEVADAIAAYLTQRTHREEPQP